MALNKQPVSLNFAKGIDQKTDPYQLNNASFTAVTNAVFDKVGRLTKRAGYANITSLPNAQQTTITTLNDNLVTTGDSLYSFSADTNQWLDKGSIQPVELSVSSLLRSSTSQTAQDSVTAANGLICFVYQDSGVSYFQVSDSATGQQVKARTALPTNAVAPRVFISGQYFLVTYLLTTGGATSLNALPISSATLMVSTTPIVISSGVASNTTGYDGVNLGGNVYFAWGQTGGSVQIGYITASLAVSAPTTIAGAKADLMSLSADSVNNYIWATYWDSTSTNGFSVCYSNLLVQIKAPTQVITGLSLKTLTSVAQDVTPSGASTRVSQTVVFYEVLNTFASPYPTAGIQSDYINRVTCTTAGTVTQQGTIVRSVGLASKAFIGANGHPYMLAAYGETYQPSYFLIDGLGRVFMRLAYSNGGGFTTTQVLPSVTQLADGSYNVSYLIKDLLTTVNKGTSPSGSQPSNAIYTQTGINLATFSINSSGQDSLEIAGSLHLTGGQLWQYDGVKPVEHGFHVWPEDVQAVWSATGGSIAAVPLAGGGNAAYYVQFCYEWTDNQGFIHRSAPSIPQLITTTGTGTTGSITYYVPTLRLTRKVSPNSVRIVGYRWSLGQQVYYQLTSVSSPVLNDQTVDYVTIVDTKSDAQILGNAIIYTTGGVVEDIAAPASTASALFKNRLFLVDAEDRNLLWYSKQVIEGVPVEMSDLLTLYVAPTSGAQGSTGDVTALSAMDDKLLIFKRDAIYYVTGIGPDNTGANNDFTDPVFITAAVGCSNPDSIVLMPNGLMFQSDKGIWLLGRDLSTNYIGAPVENLAAANEVVSAKNIPATNQVRFILNNSQSLMYDYYIGQWAVHTNINAVSATLYQGALTYLNKFGQVFQEKSGTYLDGSTPVLMSFTTAWINLAGLQGFERFYEMFLLGTFKTPFKLAVGIAFDYNDSLVQNTIVTPDNYSGTWGSGAVWGSDSGWAKSNVFEARVFPNQQKCESFQVTVSEISDGNFTGEGLSLSGLNLIVGAKKGYRTQKAGRSFG